MDNPVCERCGGSGWRVIERDGLSAAERCSCIPVETSRGNLEDEANIPPLYRKASFDNFALPEDNPVASRDLARVLIMVRTFVREFPGGPRAGMMLMGPTGTGKTHLGVAALRMLIEKGFQGVFFDYSNLLQRIRSSYDASSGSSDREAYQSALEAEVLLLDDLGAHRVSDWVEDIVTSIVTYRCNHRKALLVTTNLPDPDAGDAVVRRNAGVSQVEYRVTLGERIGERARSRLFEMCDLVRVPSSVGDYRVRRMARL